MKQAERPRPKVYVAGASAPGEIDRIESWSSKLTLAGVDVVSTWTQNVRKVGDGNPRTAALSDRKRWSLDCMTEVSQAQLLWLLVPRSEIQCRGAWAELGWAYGLAKPMIFSGDTRQSIFTALGDEYADDQEAFGAVLLRTGLAPVS